ncbi:MAG: carbamoyltransferase [Flavobacteriales bacterium]|nr:carbamoyltransferase [Flavobacteriales bacterium]|tara:strand:+ start:320 stop:2038 length:1719 start_codon:yes stop_codon:yes gene_type:complete
MYILGINAFHGDSSAALLKDGVIICAIEEERFTRIKHWAGFPANSIKYCLQYENISITDVDYITVSRNTKANLLAKIIYTLKNRFTFHTIKDRILNFNKINTIQFSLEKIFKTKINAQFYNIEHHRSHMSSSFYSSGFESSAILSIDGFGDFTSTMTAIGNDKNIDVIKTLKYPHSLGVFYTAATQFLGFNNYGDEYKVMGLAPYGNPRFKKKLLDIIDVNSDGLFRLNKKYFVHFNNGVEMNWDNGSPTISKIFNSEWINLLGFDSRKNLEILDFHKDFASSVQSITEDIVFHILNNLYKESKDENLCLSGGVAQNSVLNGKILSNTPFKNLYIPSAGHDAGTSIGSAHFLYHSILKKERLPRVDTASLGSEYSINEIKSCVESNELEYIEVVDKKLFDYVSSKIIKGKVVGWFQGRSEFGPRSLGNRSILVDPRRHDAKQLLNKKIKMRETFRPFAPSILQEYVSDYFYCNEIQIPFMEKVYKIKEDKRELIPAVTHVDGSGRLQTVNKHISPRYHSLISSFFNKSGVPIILNTSFNENEPIVNTPQEALNCFLRTDMDLLVLGNIIIEK